MLTLAPLAAGASLAVQVMTSAWISHQRPSVPPPVAREAVSLLADTTHVACIPTNEPDFFDFECQSLGAQQVFARGGRPLVIDQSWGQGTVSTGASVWPSSVMLSRYMESLGSDWWRGKSVLELGAGVGLNSLTAKALGAASVTVTDGDNGVLELEKTNALRNYGRPTLDRGFTFTAFHFDAADDPAPPLPPTTRQWDVIVASDLTYKRDGWTCFVESVRKLAGPSTTVLYATTPRHLDEWDTLKVLFRQAGFDVRDVAVPPRTPGVSKTAPFVDPPADVVVMALRRVR